MSSPQVRRQDRLLADRACFEVDEPIKVFVYGRFECDSGFAYRSAIAYGRIRIVDDRTKSPDAKS